MYKRQGEYSQEFIKQVQGKEVGRKGNPDVYKRQAWLPAAMVAPTPVSALLHAVAVVKSGVFSVLRVMYSVYGTEALSSLNLGIFVVILVSITILVASIIALRQDVLKRRLAYSTISQLSYICLLYTSRCV